MVKRFAALLCLACLGVFAAPSLAQEGAAAPVDATGATAGSEGSPTPDATAGAEAEDASPDDSGVTTRDPNRRVHRNPIQAGSHRTPANPDPGPPAASPGAPPRTYRNPSVRIGSQRDAADEPTTEGAPTPPRTPRRPQDDGSESSPESGADEAPANPSLRRRPSAASDAVDGSARPELAPVPPAPQRRVRTERLEAEVLSIEPAPAVLPPRVPRPDAEPAAPPDSATSAPPPRPARNWNKKPVASDAVPEVGDVVAVGKTGKKNLSVVKRLGGGAFGEVFVVEDREGQLSILKQQKLLPKEPPQLGDASYDGYVARVKRGKGKVLTQKELLTKSAEHEVDMQNFTARALKQARDAGQDVRDFVDEAELIGRGRIKQRYAGANFGQLLEDVDGLTDDRLREASARVLLTRMLQAAAALDAVDVVHRDLHLGNLALDDAGRAKVLDFGLAKRKGDRDVQLELTSGIGVDGQYGQNVPPETRTAKNRFDTSFASSHKADVYSIGEVFKRTVDPERAFTPLVKSPRKELVELVRELAADEPEARPTAAQALARLAQMKTPEETASEAEAETLLRGFARTRIQKALAEPPGATAVAGGASGSAQ